MSITRKEAIAKLCEEDLHKIRWNKDKPNYPFLLSLIENFNKYNNYINEEIEKELFVKYKYYHKIS